MGSRTGAFLPRPHSSAWKKLYCFPNWPLPSHRIIGPGREYHDHGPGSCFVRSNWCRPVAEVLNNHPQIFCVAMTEEQGKFCIAVDEKGWDHLPRRAPEIHLDGAICGCRLLGLSIAFPIAFPIPQNWLLGRFLLCLVFRCVEPYEIGIAAVVFSGGWKTIRVIALPMARNRQNRLSDFGHCELNNRQWLMCNLCNKHTHIKCQKFSASTDYCWIPCFLYCLICPWPVATSQACTLLKEHRI